MKITGNHNNIMRNPMHCFEHVDSPCGIIKITANDSSILSICFVDYNESDNQPNDLTNLASLQLKEYLNHKRRRFDLPLCPSGSVFQQRVWQTLTTIPYGQSTSYLSIAQRVGNPKGSRAVGRANGNNPISIVIPCHRVIGSNGALTGYAGGLSRKKWLLEHEGNWQKVHEGN